MTAYAQGRKLLDKQLYGQDLIRALIREIEKLRRQVKDAVGYGYSP